MSTIDVWNKKKIVKKLNIIIVKTFEFSVKSKSRFLDVWPGVPEPMSSGLCPGLSKTIFLFHNLHKLIYYCAHIHSRKKYLWLFVISMHTSIYYCIYCSFLLQLQYTFNVTIELKLQLDIIHVLQFTFEKTWMKFVCIIEINLSL